MAETVNIAEMAARLSTEVFSVFGWEQKGPSDNNWDCQTPSHGKRTHPTDTCFWYDNPYSSATTYLNTDLKSYATTTITESAVVDAINSLAISVECAKVSRQWKERHTHQDRNTDIVGMLFIYNHDNEYDKDFSKLRAKIDPDKLAIPPGVKLFIVGPEDVAYLATVANSIVHSRGIADTHESHLPASDRCKFYFPNLITQRAKSIVHNAATVEMLCGPWQVLHYQRSDSDDGNKLRDSYCIYYRGTGATIDEFTYLLDYLFRFQLVGNNQYITIRMPFACNEAASHFSNAKESYFEHCFRGFHGTGVIQKQKNRIIMRPITRIATRFLTDDIGMGSRHA